jgi:hypothetical protein
VRPRYRWTTCPCGLSADRDHAAAERIAARGLANQAKARRDRTGNATIRKTTDVPVRRRARRPAGAASATPRPVRDRCKNSPTPKQTRPAIMKTSSLLPLRRQAPAPSVPIATAAQRPAGRTPQVAHPSCQVPHTVSTTSRPHRVRGAILGRGFHRHVHATPVNDQTGGAGRMSDLLRIA